MRAFQALCNVLHTKEYLFTRRSPVSRPRSSECRPNGQFAHTNFSSICRNSQQAFACTRTSVMAKG